MKKLLAIYFILLLFIQFINAIEKSHKGDEDTEDNKSGKDDKKMLKFKKDKERLLKKISKMKQKESELIRNNTVLQKQNSKIRGELEEKLNKIEKLKKTLNEEKKKNNDNSNNPLNSNEILKSIKETAALMSDFQILTSQFQLETIKEKFIQKDIKKHIESLDKSQVKINEVYNNLEHNYLKNFEFIKSKVNSLKTLNENITSKLYLIENEKLKTGISRASKTKPYKSTLTTIEPNCINNVSCRTCLTDPKCVWCNKSNQCMIGDAAGSYDGTCSMLGEFNYLQCPKNKCYFNTSCGDCIKDLNCGWCKTLNRCVEGNQEKSIGIFCPAQYIHMLNYGRCLEHGKNIKK